MYLIYENLKPEIIANLCRSNHSYLNRVLTTELAAEGLKGS